MRQIAFVAGAPTGTPVGKFIALPIPYSLAGFKREGRKKKMCGKGQRLKDREGRGR